MLLLDGAMESGSTGAGRPDIPSIEVVGSETLTVNGYKFAVKDTNPEVIKQLSASPTCKIEVNNPYIYSSNGGEVPWSLSLDGRMRLLPQDSSGRVSLPMPDSNYTLPSIDAWLYRQIKLTGTLGAPRDLSVPSLDGYERVIENATNQIVTVKTVAGTGIAIGVGKRAIVMGDGTDIVRITADV